jgi:hypothetical protein
VTRNTNACRGIHQPEAERCDEEQKVSYPFVRVSLRKSATAAGFSAPLRKCSPRLYQTTRVCAPKTKQNIIAHLPPVHLNWSYVFLLLRRVLDCEVARDPRAVVRGRIDIATYYSLAETVYLFVLIHEKTVVRGK